MAQAYKAAIEQKREAKAKAAEEKKAAKASKKDKEKGVLQPMHPSLSSIRRLSTSVLLQALSSPTSWDLVATCDPSTRSQINAR